MIRVMKDENYIKLSAVNNRRLILTAFTMVGLVCTDSDEGINTLFVTWDDGSQSPRFDNIGDLYNYFSTKGFNFYQV